MNTRLSVKLLSDACEFENGDRGKNYPSRKNYVEKGFLFVNAGHLDGKKVQLEGMNYISDEQYNLLSRGKFKSGDLLFCLRGSLGKFAIVQDGLEGAIASSLIIVKPKSITISSYVGYYFQSSLSHQMIEKFAGGAAQPNLGGKDLMKFQFPCPPIEEQKQIVAILDQAFTAIDQAQANIQQNIQNAQDLFQSKLNQIFSQQGEGWEENFLDNVVDIKTGKLNANAMVEGGKYSFFTCSREVFAIDEYAFDCEAVLLAGNNASGDFNVKHFKGKFNAYQRTYVITAKEEDEINYSYLKYKLINHLKKFKEQSLGANTRFLKVGMIKDLSIQLPTYKEQEVIVGNLNNLSRELKELELSYQDKWECLEELKKSLLQKAFSGELTQDKQAA